MKLKIFGLDALAGPPSNDIPYEFDFDLLLG
jgi:hypothetical protein